MNNGCSVSACLGGCCRTLAGVSFCDIESNCIQSPAWVVTFLPTLLSIAILLILAVIIIRLRKRKVIVMHDHLSQSEYEAKNHLNLYPGINHNADVDYNGAITNARFKK